MRNVKNYILVLVILFGFNSCSKDELEATIPSYISIDKFTISTNYSTQGTSSSNITDAWVYIDNDLVGIFELPVKFPVLKEGNVKIDVYPGIKENGISERRSKYIFYNVYSEQITLKKGETLNLVPITTYTSGTNFYWMEDFESASLPFSYNAISDTVVYKTNSDVFEGFYSGKVSMIPGMDFFECYTQAFTTIPRNKTVFLELNFKCNQPVLVGLYADSDQVGVFYLNTTTTWKKIYLNFTEPIKTRSNASQYKIFFGFQSKVDYPDFAFDNLKIVHL
ncbi:MAG: hypothetical protein KDD24_09030 [Flavobacteriales bacterium]|nr:hypothetical protein [Flavobacteriales bacterium]MCB9173476.1 hypothetical protein [Flavobacteriales bacterium]